MKRLEKRARKAVSGSAPVLLRGETGCGKGVLSRWLHEHGPRSAEPFVELNCAGLKPEFLESELFGHEKGAFTGAVDRKPGLLEVADRGTVFLDEITEMDLGVQAKLLKVLEDQTFRRLGAVREQRVDVRLIAASSQKSERLGRKIGRAGVILSPAALQKLERYRWPGNIRELRNVLERAMMLADGDVLEAGDLQFDDGMYVDPADSVGFSLEEMERRHIARVLGDEAGGVERAAQRLGIPRSSLYKKIKEYGLDLPR